MPVKPIDPPSNRKREKIILTTRGKKASSFRIVVPAKIAEEAGFDLTGKVENFVVVYDPEKPGTLLIKWIKEEELI